MSKKTLKLIVGIFLCWRVGLFLIAGVSSHFFQYKPTFPHSEIYLTQSKLPMWLYSWANFDGIHYLTIINQGYLGTREVRGLVEAFFPLFPLLIKILSMLGVKPILAGLLISNSSFLGILITFFLLVKKESNEHKAWLALAVLLLFPTSFFWGALYTESLFFFFCLQAFYWSKNKRWFIAAAFIFLASATRLVGVFLIPALLFELWFSQYFSASKETLGQKMSQSFLVSLGAFGLLSYMVFLWRNYADPLYFFHVQAEFGSGRQEIIIVYPQVVWRYIKIILTVHTQKWHYFIYLQEMISGTFGLFLMLIPYRKIRPSYFAFSLGAFLLPTLTGTFSSLPRYILVCPALYIGIIYALDKYPKLKYVWFPISTALLILNTMLFIQGYWVA